MQVVFTTVSTVPATGSQGSVDGRVDRRSRWCERNPVTDGRNRQPSGSSIGSDPRRSSVASGDRIHAVGRHRLRGCVDRPCNHVPTPSTVHHQYCDNRHSGCPGGVSCAGAPSNSDTVAPAPRDPTRSPSMSSTHTERWPDSHRFTPRRAVDAVVRRRDHRGCPTTTRFGWYSTVVRKSLRLPKHGIESRRNDGSKVSSECYRANVSVPTASWRRFRQWS